AGSWIVTFDVPPPTRNLVITAVAQKADNSYILTGTFNVPGQRETPFVSGEATQTPEGIHLKITAISTAVLNITMRPDGSMSGVSTFKGQDYKFRIEKSSAVAAAPAATVTEF